MVIRPHPHYDNILPICLQFENQLLITRRQFNPDKLGTNTAKIQHSGRFSSVVERQWTIFISLTNN